MKITAYDELFDPADGDYLPIVHAGTTYKIQLALIKALSTPASGGSGGLVDPGAPGLVARTSVDTTVAVSLVKPAEGFAIINPNGVSGNPTFVLTNDLAALEALAGNGYAKRTGIDTWTTVATIPAADLDLPGEPFLGFGNPTTPIGLNAVNGSSTSAMRSDAAPALSQSISPTMTGNWTLTQPLVLGVAGSLPGEILLKGSTGGTLIVKAAPAAGDWVFSFPVNAGVPNYFLVTDGAGLTSWIMRTIAAGAGLTGGGDLTADRTIALGLPSALGVASVTSVTGTTHSHAIASSSNPGPSASILATDANGYLHLTRILADSLGVGTTTPRKLADFLSNSQSQLRLSYADNSIYTDFTVSSGGTLTVEPTGNFVFNTAGKQIDPQVNYDQNLGQVSKKYLTLWAAELWVETLVAQNTIATIGGRILVGPTTSLIADLAPAAVFINVKHNDLFTGDVVYMESSGKVEFMSITGGPATIAGGFQYSVTRDLDGSGANQWYAGDAVFDTGQAGNGFIDLYSLRGVKSASQAGPTIVGNVRNSSAYNDWSEHWAIGNLNGLYGYGANSFGAAFGKYAAGAVHVTIDSVMGYQTFSGLSTSVQQIDAAGNIRVGQVAIGQSNVFISAGALDLRLNTTVKIHLDANGSGWLANSNISWDASGNLTVSANATIAGWSVTPSEFASGNVHLAANVAVPTSSSHAWFGKSTAGYYGWSIGDGTRIIQAVANNVGIDPYIGVYDGTVFRVAIGGMNYASFPGGSSTGYGLKIGDASNNLLVEFSNTRNMIAGWTVAVGYFLKDTGVAATSAGMAPTDFPFYAGAIYANRASAPFRVTPAGALFATGATISGAITATSGDITGVLTISSATGALAIGATPPVSSSSGTGLWLDRTGLYALTSGSSRVTINSAGLNIKADGTGYLSFGTTQTLIGQESGANTNFQINVRATATYPTATIIIGADSAALDQRPALVMQAASGFASYAYFNDSGSAGFGFKGLTIGANVSGSGPLAMLDVRGAAIISGTLSLGTSLSSQKLALYDAASNFYGFGVQSGRIVIETANAEVACFTNGGQLGINTTQPAYKIDVVGGTNISGTLNFTAHFVQDQTTYRGVAIGYDTSGQIGVIAADATAPSKLAFWTYSGSSWGERLRIDSSGNVGIGTTNPLNGGTGARWLTIDGAPYSGGVIYSVSGVIKGLTYFDNSVGAMVMQSGTGVPLALTIAGAAALFISSTGAIRFNNYGAGTLITDASGNITASSDARLKTVHRVFTRGLQDMRDTRPQGRPIVYSWRPGHFTDDILTEYVGWTTQSLKATLPEAVFAGKEYDNLWDRAILATHDNAIMELDAIQRSQKARINFLEREVARLRAQLN